MTETDVDTMTTESPCTSCPIRLVCGEYDPTETTCRGIYPRTED